MTHDDRTTTTKDGKRLELRSRRGRDGWDVYRAHDDRFLGIVMARTTGQGYMAMPATSGAVPQRVGHDPTTHRTWQDAARRLAMMR